MEVLFTTLTVPAAEVVALSLVGVALVVSSLIDIKTHEVPDWITYTLTAAGIGLGIVATAFTQSWSLVYAVIGAAFGFGVGALLYYTGQWGGGDAKLLTGIGALLGLKPQYFLAAAGGNYQPVPSLLLLTGLLLLWGAVYGLAWMVGLVVRSPKQFAKAFSAKLKTKTWTRYVSLGASLLVALWALYLAFTGMHAVAGVATGLAALLYASYYLSVAVQTVEESLLRATIPVKELREGDWIVQKVMHNGKVLVPATPTGVTLDEIAHANKLAPSLTVTIKQGIPFVPSFLFAYVTLFFL